MSTRIDEPARIPELTMRMRGGSALQGAACWAAQRQPGMWRSAEEPCAGAAARAASCVRTAATRSRKARSPKPRRGPVFVWVFVFFSFVGREATIRLVHRAARRTDADGNVRPGCRELGLANSQKRRLQASGGRRNHSTTAKPSRCRGVAGDPSAATRPPATESPHTCSLLGPNRVAWRRSTACGRLHLSPALRAGVGRPDLGASPAASCATRGGGGRRAVGRNPTRRTGPSRLNSLGRDSGSRWSATKANDAEQRQHRVSSSSTHLRVTRTALAGRRAPGTSERSIEKPDLQGLVGAALPGFPSAERPVAASRSEPRPAAERGTIHFSI